MCGADETIRHGLMMSGNESTFHIDSFHSIPSLPIMMILCIFAKLIFFLPPQKNFFSSHWHQLNLLVTEKRSRGCFVDRFSRLRMAFHEWKWKQREAKYTAKHRCLVCFHLHFQLMHLCLLARWPSRCVGSWVEEATKAQICSWCEERIKSVKYATQ